MSMQSQPVYPSLPAPSPLALGPAPFPPAPPGFLLRLVVGLRRLLQRFTDALSPAQLVLWEHTIGMTRTHLLAALVRYDIADRLGDDALDAATLATRVGVDADVLHRTLRAAAGLGIFAMDGRGRFRNNRISRALRAGTLDRTREWLLYFGSGSNSAAWCDYTRSLETGKSAFDRVHGMNVWQWFDGHPDEREMFAHAMMGITTLHAPVIARLYPFAEIDSLCDVGGGRGTLLSELLLRHPHLRGGLCDGAGVIDSARQLLAARGVAERVTLHAGSFFEQVPSGYDAYLMKNILHDWDDATSIHLLGVVRRAIGPAGRLLLCEGLLDRNGDDHMMAFADLQMLVACSDGRERSRDDFARLCAAAGFRLERVATWPAISVLEAVPV